MIFRKTFDLGIISQFTDTRVDMGEGGLKVLPIKEGSSLRIVLPYKSLAILVIRSKAPLTNSINLGIGKHLWGMKYMSPDPIGA